MTRAQHVEEQQRDRVLLPGHLLAGIDSADAIQQPLEAATDAQRESWPTLHDIGHVAAERLDAQHDHAEQRQQQQPELHGGVHQNFSALISAYSR